MNKVSLFIFILLSILFIANGLYQGLVNDSWQALIFGIIVIILGIFSFRKKKKKK
ncbi:LPXTG cell wall anchor domain-containing protein [Halobacillus mangrovi]|uniref:LPXTG cell wall anchor domain-containing protein n=1 Tax=Halobacillus mangrovi TaxID=402384 RepID=UPI003D95FEE6